jgi:hypothetical protein
MNGMNEIFHLGCIASTVSARRTTLPSDQFGTQDCECQVIARNVDVVQGTKFSYASVRII